MSLLFSSLLFSSLLFSSPLFHIFSSLFKPIHRREGLLTTSRTVTVRASHRLFELCDGFEGYPSFVNAVRQESRADNRSRQVREIA